MSKITHEARKVADFFYPGCDCDACKIQQYYGLALNVVDAAQDALGAPFGSVVELDTLQDALARFKEASDE